mmetsp:Transcript_21132/g.18381  ORF Transcript_21132/g.18381 Transcript_21132/m.18381 type:complete len:83 (-) Transcript_21132:1802-2050(-)
MANLDQLGLIQTMEDLISNFLEHKNKRNIEDVEDFIWKLENDDFKETLGDAINIYSIFRYFWPDHDEFDENMGRLIEMNYEK